MAKKNSFTPAQDIGAQTDKVIFITGGTAGLGKGAIKAIAQYGKPAEIVFSSRNQKSADAVIADVEKAAPGVPLSFIQCDLTSLASVRDAAHKFRESHARLDVLMCNAGVMATEKATTKEGYEVQFGTNHMGHALLIKLLLPLLEQTAASYGDARIVSLSSIAYKQAPRCGIEFDSLKSVQSGLGIPFAPISVWFRYGQSKLANLLYPKALAKHHPSVTAVAVHPGVVGTGLFKNVTTVAKPAALLIQVFGETAKEADGWHNQVWAATCGKEKLESGSYYEPVGAKTTPSTKQARDEKLADKLWEWTQEQLAAYD